MNKKTCDTCKHVDGGVCHFTGEVGSDYSCDKYNKRNIISIWDLEINNKKLNKKSLFLVEAVKRMKRERKFHEEEYEDVICPFELILKLNEVANDFCEKRGNENAVK